MALNGVVSFSFALEENFDWMPLISFSAGHAINLRQLKVLFFFTITAKKNFAVMAWMRKEHRVTTQMKCTIRLDILTTHQLF